MQKNTKVTLAVLAGLSLASVGAGAAMASTTPAPSAPAVASSEAATSETSTTEAAGTEMPETGTESEAASDGPGGHQDASGVDVNHEGGADEK